MRRYQRIRNQVPRRNRKAPRHRIRRLSHRHQPHARPRPSNRALFFAWKIMATLVKICGVTRPQDARLAEKLGAWAVGLNFYEKSPRAVSPADAWNIRRKLAPITQAVGVFVNWKPEVIMHLVYALELTAVQLHGDETPKQLNYLENDLPVVRAFRVGPGFSMANFKRFHRASYFL